MITRYRIQQNRVEYCLKGCDDGDLMDYAEHAAIVRRLTHERDEAERLADLRLGYRVQRDRLRAALTHIIGLAGRRGEALSDAKVIARAALGEVVPPESEEATP